MKKLAFFLAMALAAIGLSSCEGPQGPIGPRGPKGEPGTANMKVYTFRVQHDDWKAMGEAGAELYYYYDILDEDMNVYLNQQGVVMVYRYNSESTQKPLPDETYCKVDDDLWHEQFDFDVYEPDESNNEVGSVRIYWTVDDYLYTSAPDTQVFRVVLMWP